MLSEIDECATGVDNCDVNALCTNTPGSFQCTCIINYSGDGVTCSGKGDYIYTHYIGNVHSICKIYIEGTFLQDEYHQEIVMKNFITSYTM